MKYDTFIWLYCILTFFACKNNSSKVEHLSLTPSSIIQDSLFTQMPGALILCGDHYLVWEDPFNPEKFLHIIDINIRREIKAIGEIGRGPKEFITPVPIKSIGNKIFTYDLNQTKQAYYSIDSLLVTKDPFILLPPLPIEDCLDIVQIAEGEFISTHPQNEQLFQWIHQDSTVSFFGKSPIKEKLKDYYNSRQGTLSYNPYNQKLIYSASLFPYIALYEKKGNNFQLKWEKISSKNFYEIKNGNIHFIEEALVPHGIILTKDYIITLQKEENAPTSTKRTAGIRDFSLVPNTIFVYDYDFNLKKIIDMGMPILRIETKGNSNTIYAVGIDLDFCIVTYEI